MAAAMEALVEEAHGAQPMKSPEIAQMIDDLRRKVDKLTDATPAVRLASKQWLGTAQDLGKRFGV
ncbi:hypothetical protein IAG41_15415 [Sphingomonas sp. JC676]|uniref:hypothetical protein n=1 Tax=Sphingomonas sp. JC676 TaxID=2768065 RepID=UPI0016586FAE|nr:hypothetical protein [Sphingomonas sp. JC676]MBC9033784.1 hypothetical protein [Sphingomonas sp. JC676]